MACSSGAISSSTSIIAFDVGSRIATCLCSVKIPAHFLPGIRIIVLTLLDGASHLILLFPPIIIGFAHQCGRRALGREKPKAAKRLKFAGLYGALHINREFNSDKTDTSF